jgi:hypothetical protein
LLNQGKQREEEGSDTLKKCIDSLQEFATLNQDYLLCIIEEWMDHQRTFSGMGIHVIIVNDRTRVPKVIDGKDFDVIIR